ncbi:MAG: hypothetical protein DRP87_18195 [Spirochaetes bacterium]|nr:MAG: hypothetical protein DRP87_18195 [Spirochaetota bacterium]
MRSEKIKIGIIGTGRIATAHLEAIMNLKEDTILTAVCDQKRDLAESTAEKFGAGNAYTDFHDLLKDPHVEAVIVCLPNYLHHSVCLEAAKAGKHILVEKPMCLNTKEAYEMTSEAEKQNVILMVGQCRRFSLAMEKVQEHIEDIGTPFRLDIQFLVEFPQPPTEWWRSSEKAGGLVTLLQGSHSVDTILWLLKKLPSRVVGFVSSQKDSWEGEDEANFLFYFDTGELASVHLSLNTSPYLHETLVIGERGSMRVFEYPTEKTFGFSYILKLNNKTILEGEQVPSLYTNQLKEFVSAIVEKRTPMASGKEVTNSMIVLDAMRKSYMENRVVSLKNK